MPYMLVLYHSSSFLSYENVFNTEEKSQEEAPENELFLPKNPKSDYSSNTI